MLYWANKMGYELPSLEALNRYVGGFVNTKLGNSPFLKWWGVYLQWLQYLSQQEPKGTGVMDQKTYLNSHLNLYIGVLEFEVPLFGEFDSHSPKPGEFHITIYGISLDPTKFAPLAIRLWEFGLFGLRHSKWTFEPILL